MVLNVNSQPIGVAYSPSGYAQIWNADPDNKAVGTLYVGTGAYCFYIVFKTSGPAPTEVLGEPGIVEFFALATENNELILGDNPSGDNYIEP